MVIIVVSGSELAVIFHVNLGLFDGKRRMSDILSGVFTVSLSVFWCVVSGRISPNSQATGLSVAKRLAVAMIVRGTFGVLGLSVKMVAVAEVSLAGRVSGLMIM